MFFYIKFGRKFLFRVWSSPSTSPIFIKKFFPVTKQDPHYLFLCIEKLIQFAVWHGTPNSYAICNVAFK